ncbi:MAG TPA: NAD(P)-dependent oxidoreductase [Ferrovibrio sp.]|uniref:NAD(P)-dependent oxidoreductase n=1 Tax=Ferrovibrio sp. TaxID=1917215 RepID=UPI002B4B1A24|nr:NAD(P)-dependent oxidoreductase [Ferrovibrio sp.]HLT75758.1 NAD(P)-dependent oxidoreductase [Ferrovibrio sp.]
MAEKMLKFVATSRSMPDKRSAGERRQDFDEIYREFAAEKAAEQASRCSQCGVPFCQVHCPLHNNIPDWLRMTAEGRLEEAYELSQATNTYPEICGRICPQDRLCEGNCVIEQSGHGTVTIGAIEKYITETAYRNGWVKAPHPVNGERPQSVGIIGAGPAGLAAADRLRRLGYQVHVYDRYDRAGGLMIYGIPNFKLEKHVVERRTKLLIEAGVQFHLNFEVGRDATLEDLRQKHDAVLIATGVYKARDIQAPGSGLGNIVPAMTYLTASNRNGLGDAVPGYEDGSLNAKGKRVVVIGGGDTAMDCVRTAIRQGAASVHCLYRRDKANMPGSLREVKNAEEEGVEFVWLALPKSFRGGDFNASAEAGFDKIARENPNAARVQDVSFRGGETVSAVHTARMKLGPMDASGRQTPVEIEGAEFDQPADLVIKALGFDPEDLPAQFKAPTLEVTRWGTVKISARSKMTNLPGVFAAGDIVRGASLVVWAIRDGRDCAEAIHQYIQAQARTQPAAQAAE